MAKVDARIEKARRQNHRAAGAAPATRQLHPEPVADAKNDRLGRRQPQPPVRPPLGQRQRGQIVAAGQHPAIGLEQRQPEQPGKFRHIEDGDGGPRPRDPPDRLAGQVVLQIQPHAGGLAQQILQPERQDALRQQRARPVRTVVNGYEQRRHIAPHIGAVALLRQCISVDPAQPAIALQHHVIGHG